MKSEIDMNVFSKIIVKGIITCDSKIEVMNAKTKLKHIFLFTMFTLFLQNTNAYVSGCLHNIINGLKMN